MRDLAEKVAIVTGAGSGIGRALALALADAGAIVVGADINHRAATETAELVAERGGSAEGHAVDVSQAEAVLAFADGVAATHGRIDLLVNNAAVSPRPNGPLLPDVLADGGHVVDTARTLVDINLLGVVHGTVACLPHLHRRPEAHLVNVSSAAGLVGFWGVASYSMTKFGVRGFTEALQMELRKTGIRVTIVYPGGVRTNIMKNSPLLASEVALNAQDKLSRTPGLMSAETAAAKILRGIRHDKGRVLLGPTPKLMSAVSRLSPASCPRLLGPVIERMAKLLDPVELPG